MNVEEPSRRRKRRGPKIIAAVLALGVVGLVGGPWVYIHWIKEKAPPPLTFNDLDTAVADSTSP